MRDACGPLDSQLRQRLLPDRHDLAEPLLLIEGKARLDERRIPPGLRLWRRRHRRTAPRPRNLPRGARAGVATAKRYEIGRGWLRAPTRRGIRSAEHSVWPRMGRDLASSPAACRRGAVSRSRGRRGFDRPGRGALGQRHRDHVFGRSWGRDGFGWGLWRVGRGGSWRNGFRGERCVERDRYRRRHGFGRGWWSDVAGRSPKHELGGRSRGRDVQDQA